MPDFALLRFRLIIRTLYPISHLGFRELKTQLDTAPTGPKRPQHLSKDRQWRSFPKVPHLLQYVSNANYYGRIKVDGKILRQSLQTTTWTTAKLRLTDFVQKHQAARGQGTAPRWNCSSGSWRAKRG